MNALTRSVTLGLPIGIAACLACSPSKFGSGNVSGPLGFDAVYAGMAYHAAGGTPTFQRIEVTIADRDLSSRCGQGSDGRPPFQYSHAYFDLLSHETGPGPRKYTFAHESVTEIKGPADLTVQSVGAVAHAVSGEIDCTALDATRVSCTFNAVMVQESDSGTSTLSGSFTPEFCSYIPDYP
jgi:hypothetical protein